MQGTWRSHQRDILPFVYPLWKLPDKLKYTGNLQRLQRYGCYGSLQYLGSFTGMHKNGLEKVKGFPAALSC